MQFYYLILIFLLIPVFSFAQGFKNIWLLGYNTQTDQYTTSPTATLDFKSGMPVIAGTNRKMHFQETQGNIADANGNLLMSSNGIWIANATGDTMLNGSGLNPPTLYL